VFTAEYYATAILGIREADRVFSAAKLFFAYGLGNALTFPLRVGATAILMAERPTVDAVRRRLTREAPTIFCGVLRTGGAIKESGAATPEDAIRLESRDPGAGSPVAHGLGDVSALGHADLRAAPS